MKNVLLIISMLLIVIPVSPQEKLTEKVEVKWWVLPLFAVDDDDRSIGNLKDKDIELFMDNRKVNDFMIYRRDFSVAEHVPGTQKKKQGVETKPLFEKKRLIFFLFDTVLTVSESIRRAKQVAGEIIAASDDNNRFVIMTIDLATGLNYHAGPLSDKAEALKIIEEKIKQRLNKRANAPGEIVNRFMAIVKGKTGMVESRYTGREIRFFEEMAAKNLKARSMSFFRSFASFYYNLNSIKDNKFIYLFSEGVSNYQQSMEREQFYLTYMKIVAQYLSRCGAVLFVINPATIAKTISSPELSGKNTLEYLAVESGGKYVEGTLKSISERINNFHRAYYEIAFADPGEMTGNIHKIKVKSKREGIRIHTLGTVERSKPYSKMRKIEKEILVLNLISQNPLYETNIVSKAVRILKISEKKGSLFYKIKVPDDYLDKKIDLYKVSVGKKISGTEIEKETITLEKNKFNIRFAAGKSMENNFVLIDGTAGTALIEGPGMYGEIPEIAKRGKALSNDPEYRKEMEKCLEGAAGYCVRLKEAAFRCFCKEKIEEIYSGFVTRYRMYRRQKSNDLSNFGGDDSGDISAYSGWVDEAETVNRSTLNRQGESKRFKKYVYDYQLISRDGEVEEQRKLLSKSAPDSKISDDKISSLVFSFLAERAVFGPITLLAGERQEQFDFRLLNFDKQDGREFAVIEAVPKTRQGTSFAYGKIWVDRENYSVRKIELDPRSILGYKSLLQRAKQLRARLSLNCEIEYDMVRGGIRLPTRIVISESYNGGPYIVKFRGGKSWERIRTTVSYKDYRFFDVDASVEKTKVKRD